MGKTLMIALAGVIGLGMGSQQEARADHHKEGKEGKEKMEVTGPVTNLSGECPNLQFTVATQQVVTQGKTEFEDISCGDITNGTAVEVKGWVKDGVLMAREVEAEND